MLERLQIENSILKRDATRLLEEPQHCPPPLFNALNDAKYAKAREYVRLTARQSAPTNRLLVLANDYPRYDNPYGNGFIHRRVKFYQQHGVEVDVVSFGRHKTATTHIYDGVSFLQGYVNELLGLLALRQYSAIAVHFPNQHMWSCLYQLMKAQITPVYFFVHGYEADGWYRRKFDAANFKELSSLVKRTFILQQFWRSIVFSDVQPAKYIFVSDFKRRAIEDDMQIFFESDRTAIIHNYIDSSLFDYVPKLADQRFKLLWVRAASKVNYAADLGAEILEKLLQSKFSDRISATVVGDGKYFANFERRFSGDSRVRIQRGYLTQQEISALHKSHGLFLVPTRLDSQGVSRDEAMSSGLVPITHSVAAVPEFVDDSVALLGPAEDTTSLVESTLRLMERPDQFLEMSSKAASSVRAKCGAQATVACEMSLMGFKQ